HIHMGFFQWLKIGALSALLASTLAWAAIMLLTPFMPDRTAKVDFTEFHGDRADRFQGKKVEISGIAGPAVTMSLSRFPAETYHFYHLKHPTGAHKAPAVIGIAVRKDSPADRGMQEKTGEKVIIRGQAWGLDHATGEFPVLITADTVQQE
ncbi:MAG: hypothetical protein PHQ27_07900, partial [Victivallales bacterium]|nr:hypothetical protein [Victivallales bacterium]